MVIDGGEAGSPCSCGQMGRYAYGSTRTAKCHNSGCAVIAYHSRPTVGSTAFMLELDRMLGMGR